MADDDLLALAQQLGGATGDEAVGGAVEAVLAHVQVGVVVLRQAVAEGLGRHGLMERGVEHGDLGHVRQHLLAGADAHQVGGVVQRAQRDVLLDGGDAGVVDQAGGGELLAAVQHAVADCADLAQVGDHAQLLVGEQLQNQLHGGVVVAQLVDLGLILLAVVLVGDVGLGIHGADALDEALGDDGLVVHVDHLILQGGGAGVDDQNFHG